MINLLKKAFFWLKCLVKARQPFKYNKSLQKALEVAEALEKNKIWENDYLKLTWIEHNVNYGHYVVYYYDFEMPRILKPASKYMIQTKQGDPWYPIVVICKKEERNPVLYEK